MHCFRVSVLVAAVVLGGCVRTNTVPLGSPTNYARVPAADVRVFMQDSDVPGPFVKIALINADAPIGFTDEKDMISKACMEAGKLGANAIILDSIVEPSAGAKIAGEVFGQVARRHGKIVAIHYTPPNEPQQQ